MLLRAAFLVQRLLVVLSYWAARLASPGRRRTPISWVVGPRETAGVAHGLAARIPGSYSVSLAPNRYYSFAYDTAWAPTGRIRTALRTLLAGPVLFGRLAASARGFVYVGANGFLLDRLDGRRFELAFLRKHGVRIACYWCGSDIRSTRLMHELEREMGLPNISTYIEYVAPNLATDAHEALVRARAQTADRFADVMFTFPTAQRSYLERCAEPAFYFVEDDKFTGNESKFENLDRIVVAHSSTSPIIKGTQLVRAAVARLKAEGYDFEYLELIDVPNTAVLAGLERTHIVLNHFYGFTTGMFALEAMAARCAVLSSTDGTIETMLPPHANDAVLVTKHDEVYEHLKKLLDEPALIEPLARRGYDWAKRYTSRTDAGGILTIVLDAVLAGTYDPAKRAALPVGALWGDND